MQVDNQSGVNIAKCKWVCNKSNAEIGTGDEVLTTYNGGTFKTETETIKLTITEEGNYYIHVLTEDKVGKRKETISEELKVTANSYKITFDSMGGTSVNQKTVKFGANYGSLTNPSWTGYTFLGWYTAKTGGVKVTNETKMTTKGATVYAQWNKNAVEKGDNVLDYGTVKNWFVIAVNNGSISITSQNGIGEWTETFEKPEDGLNEINELCTGVEIKNVSNKVVTTTTGSLNLDHLKNYFGKKEKLKEDLKE